MAEPRWFVVVGETDWPDIAKRSVSVKVDSRLRALRVDSVSGSTHRVIYFTREQSPTPARLYAECKIRQLDGSTSQRFGLVDTSATPAYTTDPASTAQAWVKSTGGNIRNNSTTLVSGAACSVGDVMGVELFQDGSDTKAQFYLNGSPEGSALTLTAGRSWAIIWSGFDGGTTEGVICIDNAELSYLPAGSQPWGAAARVADRGGYSRSATVFTDTDSDWTLDAFRKTSTGTAVASGISICNAAPNLSRRPGIFYLEWPWEADTGTGALCGLAPRDTALSTAFPGATSTSFSFYFNNGEKWNNNAGSAYGSTPVQGDVIGMLWEPSTGKIYWSINGTVQNSGDPEAGTGFAFDTATGDLVPTCSPRQGRVRLCTHAREQLYRPSYAEAWDGADLLPEQHFRDRFKRAPSVRREVSFAPWANQRSRGAAIGNLDINNADGEFDALSEYDLRDQEVIAYVVRADGSTAREWTGLVDGVTLPDMRTARIAIADKTARLDMRVASPVFALGAPELIPSKSRIGSVIASDVAQSTSTDFRVYDQALEVNTWARSDVDGVAGFERTVNPAGLQSVRDFELVADIEDAGLVNGDFASGSTGWSTAVVGVGTTQTPLFSGGTVTLYAQDDLGSNSWYNELSQTLSFETGASYLLRFEIVSISSDIQLVVDGGLVEPGFHTVLFVASGPSGAIGFQAIANPVASMPVQSVVLDNVTLRKVQPSTIFQDSFEYLLQTEGGLTAADWAYTAHFAPYSPGRIGFWSDDRPTIRAVLDEVCESVLADYYTDADGVIQIAWLVPPEEVDSADAEYLGEIAESEIYGELAMSDDYAPRLSTVAEYQRNYAQHNDGDIAGAVTDAVRQYVTSEWRENILDTSSPGAGDAGPLHPFYAFANDAPAMRRLLVNDFTDTNTPSDGSTTVDNRLILLHRCYASRRRFYRFRLKRDKADELGLRPGGVCEVTHARYGLASGKNLMCVAIEPQLTSPTVGVTFWG